MVAGDADEIATTNRTTVERRSDREIVMTRTFNGRARVVFDAWTLPEIVKRWWAPKSHGVVMFACEADVRVGGAYRYVFGREGGPQMAFSGTYTEVTPPTRLVYTQIYEQMRSAGEAVNTATFHEQNGKTRLVLVSLYPSKEALDGAIASGMEHGTREVFDQLDALVGAAGAAS